MQVEQRQTGWGWVSGAITVAIALAAMAGVVAIQRSRLTQTSLWLEDPVQATRQEQAQLKFLKQMPSFGFDNLIADWVFLNFLEYYGDDIAREKTGFGLSPEYFDIITRRDPRFVGTYPFLSSSISYQLGKPELAVEMMKRGTAVLSPEIDPLAFRVWRFMSLDQLLLLGDIPGAIQSLRKAADWVEGTSYADLATNFRQTAEFLQKDPDSKAVRVGAWGSVYQQAVAVGDKQTQERAKRELLKLGSKIVEKEGQLLIQPLNNAPTKPPQK